MRNVTNCVAQKGPLVQRGLSAKLTGGLLQPLRPSRPPSLTQGRLGVRLVMILLVFVFTFGCIMPVFAADGNVKYSGDAGKFIFAPGSEHSLTDLFPNFKDVMPGDSLTQAITIKNGASNKVKIKVYMRALGTHEESAEFLSQFHLRVKKSKDNTMAYMFDAQANEKAQLFEWVCLGTLYSGGEIKLDVSLDVPVELDNQFQNQVGYLDWEFMIEELEIEPTDPEPPKTGDDRNVVLWFGLMFGSAAILFLLVLLKKKKKEEDA